MNKDCKFCAKPGLPILPLRTSAVWSANAATLKQTPKLADHTGKRIKAVSLSKAQYTTRVLRQGYVYKLEERLGVRSWTGYYITPDAFLYVFPVETPPVNRPSFSCDITTHGINASMIMIERPEFCDKAWFLFSPDPVTPAMLNAYKANPDHWVGTGALQFFSPKVWAASQAKQDHVFPPEELAAWVTEYRAIAMGGITGSGKALNDLLDSQMFPPMQSEQGNAIPCMLEAHTNRWKIVQQTLIREKGAALVLYDAIGVAQELNDIRNTQVQGIRPWLQATDKKGISNEWKLQVAQHIVDGRKNLNESITRQQLNRIDVTEQQNLALPKALGVRDPAEAQRVEAERNRRIRERAAKDRAEAKAASETHFNKYLSRLRMKDVEAILAEHQKQVDLIDKGAEDYAGDHLAFLKSTALATALAHYDQAHADSGIAFGIQVGQMVLGMGGTKAGDAQVMAWLRDITIGDRNWLLKGFCFNHAELMAAQRTLLSEYQGVTLKNNQPDWGGLEKKAQLLKAVPDLMDKMMGTIEEAHAHGGNSWFQTNKLGMALSAYVPLMQGVLKFANPSKAERMLAQAYMGAMRAWMGKVGQGMALFQMVEEQRRKHGALLVSTVGEEAKKTLDRLMSNSKHSDFYKMRLIGLIAAFEIAGGACKLMKASATEEDARFYAETFSSCIGGLAALIEVIGQGIGLVADHAGKEATKAVTSTVMGGLKLWAAKLAGAAGIISAYYDWQDGDDRLAKQKYAVANLYYVKSAFGVGVSLLAIGIGFTFSGPYLERVALRTSNAALKQAFLSASSYAKDLAKRTGVFWSRIGFMTWVARLSWFVTIAQIIIWYIDDDELEDWCGKSVFRQDLSGAGFRSPEIELKTFADAINAVS